MFITFEGVEGCGKTTQARLLAERLEAQGCRTLVTREPGGAAISEQIRAVLLDHRNDGMDSMAEALLYEAARAQFVAEIVRPALAAGRIVICDRFADSTLAYQGYGRGLDLDILRTLNRIATDGLTPDITFLLDIPVAQGLKRRERGGDWNRMDNAGRAFHERVYNGYHVLVRAEPQRWRIIDARGAVPDVARAVWSAVAPLVASMAATAID
jgi:dTMP kinase